MRDFLNMGIDEKITQDELLKNVDGHVESGVCEDAEYKSFDTTCGGRVLLYPNRRTFFDGQKFIYDGWQFTYHSSVYGGPTSTYVVDGEDKIKFKLEDTVNQ